MAEFSYKLNYQTSPENNQAAERVPGSANASVVRANLKSFALGCIARLLPPGQSAEEVVYEQVFLQQYRQHIGHDDIRDELADYLRAPRSEDCYLVDLADKLGLSQIELLTIALALAVEEDPMTGRAIAYVQAPVGGSRPTLGLLQAALLPVAAAAMAPWGLPAPST